MVINAEIHNVRFRLPSSGGLVVNLKRIITSGNLKLGLHETFFSLNDAKSGRRAAARRVHLSIAKAAHLRFSSPREIDGTIFLPRRAQSPHH
jgi:hypothetical protein